MIEKETIRLKVSPYDTIDQITVNIVNDSVINLTMRTPAMSNVVHHLLQMI